MISSFFFFNDTATTEIYTLSLHDALPISTRIPSPRCIAASRIIWDSGHRTSTRSWGWLHMERLAIWRSEEHTSELQSLAYLVCRLLLEKKKRRRSDRKAFTTPVTSRR